MNRRISFYFKGGFRFDLTTKNLATKVRHVRACVDGFPKARRRKEESALDGRGNPKSCRNNAEADLEHPASSPSSGFGAAVSPHQVVKSTSTSTLNGESRSQTRSPRTEEPSSPVHAALGVVTADIPGLDVSELWPSRGGALNPLGEGRVLRFSIFATCAG